MSVIHKIVLQDSLQTFMLPDGSKVLSVQSQDNMPTVWYQVPFTNATKVPRVFRILATGQEFEPASRDQYLGTVQTNGGQYVFHVFEVCRG